MKLKMNSVLKEVLEKIKPTKDELKNFDKSIKEFLKKIKQRIKKLKINAEIFVGGSFAKNTIIKKDKYDVDIFLRFDKKYEDLKISDLTKKILNEIKNKKIIHGSRDYFSVKLNSNFFIEIIPVLKVKNAKNAKNITDLSYSHVRYFNKKIKSKKIFDEIRLAKSFCYANNCYGAESYIKGFSGYSLELLIYHYKSFVKFLDVMIKTKEKKVIDIEKHFKNKQEVLMNINTSKLGSPIILIDPTYKYRNTLAALSDETFEKFKKHAKKFLKNPSIESFELKKTNIEKIKKDALKKNYEFILIEIKTNKQEGDVAGTKLLKFYNHLNKEIKKFFEIKNNGFNYNQNKSARFFIVLERKKEILYEGPYIKDLENIKKFKKIHKTSFIKKGKIYSKEKINFNIEKFLESWKKKNKNRLKEMYIDELKVVK